jgi:hypothetical protein
VISGRWHHIKQETKAYYVACMIECELSGFCTHDRVCWLKQTPAAAAAAAAAAVHVQLCSHLLHAKSCAASQQCAYVMLLADIVYNDVAVRVLLP